MEKSSKYTWTKTRKDYKEWKSRIEEREEGKEDVDVFFFQFLIERESKE